MSYLAAMASRKPCTGPAAPSPPPRNPSANLLSTSGPSHLRMVLHTTSEISSSPSAGALKWSSASRVAAPITVESCVAWVASVGGSCPSLSRKRSCRAPSARGRVSAPPSVGLNPTTSSAVAKAPPFTTHSRLKCLSRYTRQARSESPSPTSALGPGRARKSRAKWDCLKGRGSGVLNVLAALSSSEPRSAIEEASPPAVDAVVAAVATLVWVPAPPGDLG
mmetsp:Transcript_5260/g.18927  ORF Transcript_5260/g.18927 Transcript_5260/m.18927 type:complete len:221 (-) Transcript_5260:2480-3142(-)